ncbi:hypothetical protein GCM10017559_64570 [Streptosporangium longisporum]|uniref:Uncharacterized protein n=1 Tax=Streptosporangium longisporum TaxID=46187 RepID=A0ABP6L2I8_9ACTN
MNDRSGGHHVADADYRSRAGDANHRSHRDKIRANGGELQEARVRSALGGADSAMAGLGRGGNLRIGRNWNRGVQKKDGPGERAARKGPLHESRHVPSLSCLYSEKTRRGHS